MADPPGVRRLLMLGSGIRRPFESFLLGLGFPICGGGGEFGVAREWKAW